MAKTQDIKCPYCNAVLKFDSKTQKMKCEYCGNKINVEELKESDNHVTDSKLVSYNCPDCGAQIVCDDQTTATFCIYCGNTSILKSKLEGEFRPSRLIPFKNTKEDAVTAFKNLSKGHPLMPKFFNDEKNIEKIKGVYIPFWLYRVYSEGLISGSSTTSTSWTVGDIRYTKTDRYNFDVSGFMYFKNVPVDGSTRFDDAIMDSLEPYNFADLIPFKEAYLSGYLAEKYDINKDDCFNRCKVRCHNTATSKLLGSAKSPGLKTVSRNTLSHEIVNSEYILLPVWMVNIKYNNKYYLFAMNGQTGELVGNIPVSPKKVFLYSLLIFGICTLVCLLVCLILYYGGGLS